MTKATYYTPKLVNEVNGLDPFQVDTQENHPLGYEDTPESHDTCSFTNDLLHTSMYCTYL